MTFTNLAATRNNLTLTASQTHKIPKELTSPKTEKVLARKKNDARMRVSSCVDVKAYPVKWEFLENFFELWQILESKSKSPEHQCARARAYHIKELVQRGAPLGKLTAKDVSTCSKAMQAQKLQLPMWPSLVKTHLKSHRVDGEIDEIYSCSFS
jgi:hypothetical protein